MPAPPFECPNCFLELKAGTSTCPRCGIRLSGTDAARLWEVDQQIGALRIERTDLIGRLLQPEGAALTKVAASPYRTDVREAADDVTRTFDSGGFESNPIVPEAPKKTLTAQQILLALGAVLVLSAASFFLLVVWLLVGLVGQALIMAALTATAVSGSVVATRRALPAAAETAAVLASGLLVIDLSAAHSLGLAGLDRLSFDRYWMYASIVAAALLVGFDRLVPRTTRTNEPARRVTIYRPVAAAMAAATPWLLVSHANLADVTLVAALGMAALVNAATALVAVFFESAGPPRTAKITPAVGLLLGVGAVGFALHVLAGLALGFDTSESHSDRYTVVTILMLLPVVGAVMSTSIGTPLGLTDKARAQLPYVCAIAAVPPLGIVAFMLPYPAWVVLAVACAVAAVARHMVRWSASTPVRQAWQRTLTAGTYTALPAAFLAMFVLSVDEHASLEMRASDGAHPDMVLVVACGVLWALASAVAIARTKSTASVVSTHVSVLGSVFAALWNAENSTALATTLTCFAVCVGVASIAARRLAQPDETARTFWQRVDHCTVLFGALYGLVAVVAASGPGWFSIPFITVGVLTLIYAAAPQRLPFAYAGSLSISVGTANLLTDASISVIEAYTAPLVVLLAAIGAVQWSRNRDASTVLTMGPALSVAFGPSLLDSLTAGDTTRLALVTFAAVVVLVLGLAQRWKAPVTVSALVLVVVAVTQGGPLTSYIPGWVTLGTAGAALLTAGIAWEHAVVAGRRAHVWYDSLS